MDYKCSFQFLDLTLQQEALKDGAHNLKLKATMSRAKSKWFYTEPWDVCLIDLNFNYMFANRKPKSTLEIMNENWTLIQSFHYSSIITASALNMD